eukprot:365196-Chlamydomonas_euryale.AAC.8
MLVHVHVEEQLTSMRVHVGGIAHARACACVEEQPMSMCVPASWTASPLARVKMPVCWSPPYGGGDNVYMCCMKGNMYVCCMEATCTTAVCKATYMFVA